MELGDEDSRRGDKNIFVGRFFLENALFANKGEFSGDPMLIAVSSQNGDGVRGVRAIWPVR